MRKVLIVEDSAAMRGLIVGVVEDLGDCECVEAANGFEGLRALRALPADASYALVVTDINMPDINGLELLAFVRRGARTAATPVLIVSSVGSEKDRDRGMALGASAYLTKPFDPVELAATVRRLLGAPA